MKQYWLPALSLALFIAALYLVFVFVPTEASMGVVQRIFYFHVPVAWVAFLAFFIVFIASILYLSGRNDNWDLLAAASAEIGVVFTTLVLVTGPIWARPAWGKWWVWEPRLTTALVLWFIYAAYLLVRSYAGEEARGARFAAVVGIVGFVDVPIVFLATTLWPSGVAHPPLMVFRGDVVAPMVLTLLVCLAAFTTLYVILLRLRLGARRIEREIRIIRDELEERAQDGPKGS